jgi:hypothetical protein
MKEDEAALTIQSLEKNTATDAGSCSIQESGKLNENESDHMEECEAKGNEHDQTLTGQSQIKEKMFDHQEYNEAENLKESDSESPKSRKSTRKILAQLIKKVDKLTVEVRSSKKEAAPKSESSDNLTR